MKKNNIISIAIFVIVVGGAAAWKFWPRVVPYAECSEVYRQWADVDGVRATFLRGYRVNDSVIVDATLLQASDSAGWETAKKAFGIKEPSQQKRMAIACGKDILEIAKIDTDTNNYDIAVASHRDRYVCVFHTSTQKDKECILGLIIKKMFNSLTINKKFIDNEESD